MPTQPRRGFRQVAALALIASIGAISVIAAWTDGVRADPNVWTPTGPLAGGRFQSAASLLPDGRVLISGGRADSSSYSSASAELYDPATNSWSSAAPMPGPRHGHVQVTLSSGKVLVGCGFGFMPPPYADPVAAYLYDPATNEWSSAGSNGVAHTSCSATLLADGRVLMAGGLETRAAEVYDPVANSWSSAGTQVVERQSPSIVRLSDGRVLLAGGYFPSEPGEPVPAELYDPATNTWSLTGSTSYHHWGAQAALLPNGHVLIAGGPHDGWPSDRVEIYNPATGTWQDAAPMPFRSSGPVMRLLPNGLAFVNGGSDKMFPTPGVNIPLAKAAVYHYTLDAWTTLQPMSVGRYGHTLTLLSDGTLVSAGGLDRPLTAEVYEPGPVPPPDTPTSTPTHTNTSTPSPTRTPTFTPTSTHTPTPEGTATPTPTGSLTPTVPPPTPTVTPTPTGTPTVGADNDGDGCADVEELGPDKKLGGQRDPGNRWDFYDVDGSKKVDAIDVGLVRSNFDPFGPLPPEDAYLDRGAGAAQWAPGPPDGVINGLDINLVRIVFLHSCQAPP